MSDQTEDSSSPERQPEPTGESTPPAGRRACPLCNEQIAEKAVKCKHCRSMLECPFCREPLTRSGPTCEHCDSNLSSETKTPAPIVEVKAEPMPPAPQPQQMPAAPVQQVSIQPVVQPPAPVVAPQAAAPAAAPVNVQFNAPTQGGSGDDAARRMLAGKSYVGMAFLTLFGYWFGYIPGLIMNFIFLSNAKRDERIAGQPMSGKGCLVLLIWLQFYIPLVLTILSLIVGAIILVIGLATGEIDIRF